MRPDVPPPGPGLPAEPGGISERSILPAAGHYSHFVVALFYIQALLRADDYVPGAFNMQHMFSAMASALIMIRFWNIVYRWATSGCRSPDDAPPDYLMAHYGMAASFICLASIYMQDHPVATGLRVYAIFHYLRALTRYRKLGNRKGAMEDILIASVCAAVDVSMLLLERVVSSPWSPSPWSPATPTPTLFVPMQAGICLYMNWSLARFAWAYRGALSRERSRL